MPLGFYNTEETGQLAMDSTGDKATFSKGIPVDVIRWGVLADALIDVGAGFTMKCDKRPTMGSDASRGDGDFGDITTIVDIAQGAGVYTEEITATAVTNSVPNFNELDPGEELVFQVTDAADTAGTGIVFIEYRVRPFVGDSNITSGLPGNRIGNMTTND